MDGLTPTTADTLHGESRGYSEVVDGLAAPGDTREVPARERTPAEAGAAAVLIALGLPPTTALAGVLLYRGFIVAAEVPVGGAWLLGWFGLDRLQARKSRSTADQEPVIPVP